MNTKGRNSAPTLCWDCIHSVPSPRRNTGCPWPLDGKPVPGWKAKRHDISISHRCTSESYIVEKCPKFSRD